MQCSQCGSQLPNGSLFCLRCGAAVTPAVPSSQPHNPHLTTQVSPLNSSQQFSIPNLERPRTGVPLANSRATRRTLTIASIVGLAAIVAATAAVMHGRGSGMTNSDGGSPDGSGLMSSRTLPSSVGGLTNAQRSPDSGAGLLNASAAPPPPASGLSNARGATPNGTGLLNATGRDPYGRGLTNAAGPQPYGSGLTNQTPGPAAPMDDPRAYLEALRQIELARVQLHERLDAVLPELKTFTVSVEQESIEAALSDDPQADTKFNDDVRSHMQQAVGIISSVADGHLKLLQRVDMLQQKPGVPQSCGALQQHYRAMLAPYVKLGNSARVGASRAAQDSQLVGPAEIMQELAALLPKLSAVSAEVSQNLGSAEYDLTTVCRSHGLPQTWVITDTEKSGSSLLSGF